ncbi:carbohydrate ABC transporter permease [Vibrio sp. DW001]|uniref:carbohydrate ABC transporter permease n=1 Tax=Vibrio sp. DW001 TaxID=2912315 RepID=UPI0023B0501C|nr:carbohydrate ABC transporter permease [Vibrio sp. DW001]WED26297.1 carbohydrate ABC transporter permease [Vibrio sp. DW001]
MTMNTMISKDKSRFVNNNEMPKGRKLTVKAKWARFGIYGFLIITALFFLLPLYVMLVTSFKEMDEIRISSIFSLPQQFSFNSWKVAWSSACTGLECSGLQVGFWNSVQILIPSVVISVMFGAINGYALSFWKIKGANLLFACLLLGAFIPYQVFIYPLIRVYANIGIYGTLSGVVLSHVIFGMPIMTLLFRNYYSGLPVELFNAARIDGAGFFKVFFSIIFPMSVPIIIVAVIMQVTNIWNDFLIGLVFGGNDNLPMTVQLNNIVNTTTGERAYNVNMAATILTSLVPLIIYVASGRWFVRGIASGAVKG